MSDLLLSSIIDSLNNQTQSIYALQEKIAKLQTDPNTFNEVKADIHALKQQIEKVSFPDREVKQLNIYLKDVSAVLQQPLKNEVIHHHHVPKLTWITAGLFLLLCMVCSGWYMTGSKLGNYIANDTKYRYLKLSGNKTLLSTLGNTDSLYNKHPDMRDAVTATEAANEQRVELQQEADEKQKEADALRVKAKHQRR